MAVKTRIYSSFDDFESAALQDFKKECFYVTGEDVKNHDFWQQFFNLFFIFYFIDLIFKKPADKVNTQAEDKKAKKAAKRK